MGKNIILCADGTGNKGGYTPESNVYKTYHAVELHNRNVEQITFYDNGVGTSSNKIKKALGGAVGLGFRRNVCDLYTFLCKNYVPNEDKIYVFGFSRGAATVRALNGFIHDCGLIDARDYTSDTELKIEVKKLIKAYLKKHAPIAFDESVPGVKANRNAASVEFVGVWDTVAALGMPKHTDKIGPISWLLDKTLHVLDSVFNFFLHYNNYNYQLTPNITHACQALSIDDARASFWPRIWNELDEKTANVQVEQVWFPGMHTDVGGGYNRQGMSNVPLTWMLVRAEKAGLKLIEGKLAKFEAAANAHDIMHNSRSGFGMFYRPHPREIETLCKDERDNKTPMMKNICIHQGALSRMYYRTAGYAPKLLPANFNVVDNAGSVIKQIDTSQNTTWLNANSAIKNKIRWIKELYIVQLVISLTILIPSFCAYRGTTPINKYPDSIWNNVAEALRYVLPDFFNNAIIKWVVNKPEVFVVTVAVIALWATMQIVVRNAAHALAQIKRTEVLKEYTH